MKRRAFILTEILTGMMLQVMFAVVLCSAFYMILNFSTSAQQGFAANDKGQMVIAYFDSRIRNAGLGMWKCHGSADVRASLASITALQDTNLCLPAAIVSSTDTEYKVSHDNRTGVYSGNVVTLLYAHKDTNEITSESGNPPVRLILITDDLQSKTVTNAERSNSNNFQLIDNKGNHNISSYTSSNFFKGGNNENIRNYAVMESSGIPMYTSLQHIVSSNEDWVNLQAPSAAGVTVYPMSEMLNLECQKLYVRKDANGYNFVFHELNNSGSWGKFYYHTKDILDLYMTLDTRPNTPDRVPIFELRVLVSEGINEQGTTTKPKDWPGRWKNTGFDQYKVHVSKAAWKLYNLVPQFH